jgi:hypothetical protein
MQYNLTGIGFYIDGTMEERPRFEFCKADNSVLVVIDRDWMQSGGG